MKGKLRRQIQGEVSLKATGTQTSRFAALLLKKGILCRDMRYEKGALFFTIPFREKKQTESCAEKSGTYLEVCCQSGLQAWWKRYRNRWGFLIALVLSLSMVTIFSQFIWTIRIEGINHITQTEMLTRLEAHGIREGIWRWGVNTESIREEMLLAYPDLSWLSLTMEGSCLCVRTAETTAGPQMQTRTQPSDLVAAQTCVIYSIITEKGTPQVKQGDVVQEGDPLIRGRITLVSDDGTETYQYIEAKGEIYGKCQYELQEEIPYTYRKKIYEKKRSGWIIYWGDHRFSIKNPFRSWENYDTIGMEIGSGVGKLIRALPGIPYVAIEKAEYYPYTEETAEYTEEEAEQLLKERLELRKEQLLQERQGVLLQEDYRLEEIEGGRRAVLVLTVMEDIGKSVPLTKDETEESRIE